MSQVDLEGKRVLEVGGGNIQHNRHWNGTPETYTIADVSRNMLERAAERLRELNVPHSSQLLAADNSQPYPFPDNAFDVVVSFYALEHIVALQQHLDEIQRVLAPGGMLVGGIPCEGGLAWGAGRFLTSRRWLKRNTDINPDKIICWEHPNFAETVLSALDARMNRHHLSLWPFRVPSIDLNLLARFVYENA